MAQVRVMIVVLAALVNAGPTGLALRQAQGERPQPRPTAVVDNGEFMDLFLKTSYVELQQAMAKPPADRKAWATIYQKAIRLAEMQNLLFFRDRDEVKDPRWAAAAAESRQAAADLANAAVASLRNLVKADYNAVRAKYAAVATACNACHTTFARDAPTIKQ